MVVSDYISDHAMIKCKVETPTTTNSQANRVTYRRYHKINMDSLHNDLSNSSFVACPGDTAKKLYDQYTNDLSNLLDKHAPGADFTKGLKSRFRLKSKTLVLNFVKKLLSLWS